MGALYQGASSVVRPSGLEVLGQFSLQAPVDELERSVEVMNQVAPGPVPAVIASMRSISEAGSTRVRPRPSVRWRSSSALARTETRVLRSSRPNAP